MKKDFIWANLLQLGCNGWNDDVNNPDNPARKPDGTLQDVTWGVSDTLRFDEKVWRDLTERTRDVGMNMLVLDLYEGIVYPSHPELAVKGSWMPDKLRAELARLRKMGLEPIPKINFSANHDIWLKEYSRMLSSPPYYKVCSEIIRDVYELFDHPRFIHIGMDEECAYLQGRFTFLAARQGDLWFHDLDFLAREVSKTGARPWMWSDACWAYPKYHQKVSKSIVQSNWYYWKDVKTIEPKADLPPPPNEARPECAGPNHVAELRGYLELERSGYDQIPGASSFYNLESMEQVADLSFRRISPERLKGMFLMSWAETINEQKYMSRHDAFYPEVEKIIKRYS